jgi:hypothetical protein
MSDKTGKQKAADVKAARAAKAAKAAKTAKEKKEARALRLKKQVADLSTFKKTDSQKWTSKNARQRKQDVSGTGIVGLRTLGQTTKVNRSRTYKPKKTK